MKRRFPRCRPAFPEETSPSRKVPPERTRPLTGICSHDPSDNQEQVLCELGFDSLARDNLREALGTLSARQAKVINERFFTANLRESSTK